MTRTSPAPRATSAGPLSAEERAPNEGRRSSDGGQGERWGCLVIDRASRFVVAHAIGPRDEALAERAVWQTQVRSAGQAVAWCKDGWPPHPAVIEHAFRQPVHTRL
jgi:IS1 family transposase